MPEIRPMEERHLPGVLAVEEASFSTPWSHEAFAFELDNPLGVYLVAEEEGEVLGYGGFRFLFDQGDLTNIAVLPLYRGKGIGAAILLSLLKLALLKGVKEMFLEVRESNEVARRLYESFGFQAAGRRPGYYSRPSEDAIIMKLEMKDVLQQ